MNERSLRRETGVSSAEGERERLSFLRVSFKKLTEVSRFLDDGGTSSGGSTSGIAEPLSPRGMVSITSTRLKQILTTINESHL